MPFATECFAIFAAIKAMNTLKRLSAQEEAAAPPAAPPEPSTEEKLLTEIRDLLAKR